MKNQVLSFLAVAWLAMGLTPSARAQNFETGDLQGRIMWNGAALSGNSVTTVYTLIPGLAGRYINSSGAFSFAAILAGSYNLEIYGNGCSIPGYRLGGGSATVTAATTTSVDIDITPTAGRVTGTITVDGVPLSSPTITVPGLCGNWVSQSNGSFAHFLKAGTYTATVSGSAGALGDLNFTVTAGGTTDLGTVNFQSSTLAGAVKFNGDAVTGASVQTIYVLIPGIAGQYLNSSGRFSFVGLRPGSYELSAYGNGCSIAAYRLGTLNVTTSPGQTLEATFEIAPTAGRVIGTVAVNGAPLSNPSVSVPGFCGTWWSNSSGNFAHYLPAGTHTVNISGTGGSLGTVNANVVAGQTLDLGTLNFESGAIAGRVLFHGNPVVGAFVQTIYAIIPGVAGSYLGSNGTFSVTGLRVGDYGVEVYGNGCSIPGYRLGTATTTVTAGGVTPVDVDITPTAGRITGRITVNGVPLPNPSISIPGFCGTWWSNNTGTFSHYLPVGTYTANVSGPSGYIGSFTFTVAAGETTYVGFESTAPGRNVVVRINGGAEAIGGVTLTFDEVVTGGTTTGVGTTNGAAPPAGYRVVELGTDLSYWQIATTAGTAGSIRVCMGYDPAELGGVEDVQIVQITNGNFVDITTESDPAAGIVCGIASSLGTFAVVVDIDECAAATDNCSDDAICTNTPGTFACDCKAGFSGNGVTCTDLDECAANTDNCDDNATCTNTPGTFACACKPGYSGNGVTCGDIDECTAGGNNCDANALCTNNAGSFACACKAGYSGNGVTCGDIDECTANTDNCSDDATCTNNAGSFACACKPGYSGNGVTCADIDECAANTDNCSDNATCTNNAGSFACACKPGYSGNGVTCTDIDECTAGGNNCDANALCTNNAGS
ncbi:MAG: hypothetical protein JNJ59_08910, partial [Deltaproteobacteria bacterium]|nr:hypothetical protein [Deltaproteobacteria bacterium]